MMLRLCRLLAALWWGAMAGMAFIAVPVIFSVSPEKALAGSIAARIFDVHAFWVMAGGLLVAIAAYLDPMCRTRRLGLLLSLTILAAALNHWLVAPMIVSARVTGGDLALWHGLGSVLIALCFVLGGVVNWRLSSRQSLFP